MRQKYTRVCERQVCSAIICHRFQSEHSFRFYAWHSTAQVRLLYAFTRTRTITCILLLCVVEYKYDRYARTGTFYSVSVEYVPYAIILFCCRNPPLPSRPPREGDK